MKNLLFKILLLSTVLLFISPSCKKNKGDDLSSFTHRVVSSKSYENDQLNWQGTYQYSGDKLINASSESVNDNWSDEYIFSYPDNNTIIVNYTETYNSEEDEGIINFTLENNNVIEILWANDEEVIFSYNSDGTFKSVQEFYYNGSWTLGADIDYIYSSGKLIQILYIEYGSEITYEDKTVFSYMGDEINYKIYSSKESGGGWIESHKYVYTYSEGNITKITSFYKNESSIWEESSYYEEYSYDSFGDLIEMTGHDGDNYSYTTEYTYEEGVGNFHQITESLGNYFDPSEPIPNKKSQNREGNLLKPHHFISGNSFFNLAH